MPLNTNWVSLFEDVFAFFEMWLSQWLLQNIQFSGSTFLFVRSHKPQLRGGSGVAYLSRTLWWMSRRHFKINRRYWLTISTRYVHTCLQIITRSCVTDFKSHFKMTTCKVKIWNKLILSKILRWHQNGRIIFIPKASISQNKYNSEKYCFIISMQNRLQMNMHFVNLVFAAWSTDTANYFFYRYLAVAQGFFILAHFEWMLLTFCWMFHNGIWATMVAICCLTEAEAYAWASRRICQVVEWRTVWYQSMQQ